MTNSEAQNWYQDQDQRMITVLTRHSTEQETDRKDEGKEVGANRESENKAKANGNGNPYLRVGSDAIRGHVQDKRRNNNVCQIETP
ncbi:hypothetical protein N7447_000440 [Penicillium robsamsonii]|uniref:uncharacterized protein n=1 Tax=Penicillium robsamsonii TaxID=1792511 RepID=UPI0025485981|nr:uncharacterized protein N7447_000440 [Penicillium robsamsonii]KAJ5834414.1 hypothetical protein N7447_000440 [Penicillium robsamsonii]